MSCPTVKVACDNEQGFMIINESDFDDDNHLLYEPKAKKEVKTKKEPAKK